MKKRKSCDKSLYNPPNNNGNRHALVAHLLLAAVAVSFPHMSDLLAGSGVCLWITAVVQASLSPAPPLYQLPADKHYQADSEFGFNNSCTA
jgi:hypothetical protein